MQGIKLALLQAFQDIDMAELKDKMVLWASNGASLNSGVKARLATKFHEDGLEWLAFVWCVSHHLRVIIKWKFRWCARTSQRKSYSLVLLVSQVVQKDKGVMQAPQCVERLLQLWGQPS